MTKGIWTGLIRAAAGALCGFIACLICLLVIMVPLSALGLFSWGGAYLWAPTAAIVGTPLGALLWVRRKDAKAGAKIGLIAYGGLCFCGSLIVDTLSKVLSHFPPGQSFPWGKFIGYGILNVAIFALIGLVTGAAAGYTYTRFGTYFEPRMRVTPNPPRPRRLGEEPPPINL